MNNNKTQLIVYLGFWKKIITIKRKDRKRNRNCFFTVMRMYIIHKPFIERWNTVFTKKNYLYPDPDLK